MYQNALWKVSHFAMMKTLIIDAVINISICVNCAIDINDA